MESNTVYEQINDDQNEEVNRQVNNENSKQIIHLKRQLSSQHNIYTSSSQKQHISEHNHYSNQQQLKNKQTQDQTKIEENQIPILQDSHHKNFEQHTPKINQQDLGKYINFAQNQQDGQNIKIQINKTQKKGGIMSTYFVYFIQGYDKKGHFSVSRRFNEFFQMRAAMVLRWPGCFVPSIPAKNTLIKKRTRYLNNFVKKMAKLPHLFYGQQFQTLLRAQEPDISQLFTKWPTLTSQSIINKYRINFSQLAGKQLNYQTNEKVKDFQNFIKKNQAQLIKDRQNMKNLAISHEKLIKSYNLIFPDVFLNYQKNCLLQYCNQKQVETLYLNQNQIKLQQHQTISKQVFRINPYWSFYDMIRHQQRDGLAFLQALQAKNKYQNKKHQLDIKITTNQKHVAQLCLGKKPFGLSGKGTNQQIKYKLQVEIEELKRQKQNILIIIDIITAMITYIEIQRYKEQKNEFYKKALKKIGTSQISQVQNLGEIWNGLKQATDKRLNNQGWLS